MTPPDAGLAEAPSDRAPSDRAPTAGAPTAGAPTAGAPTAGAPTAGAPTAGAPSGGAPPGEAWPGEGAQRPAAAEPAGEEERHDLLYQRVLHLHHVRLARWQAVLLFDGVLVAGVLLALAEVASAWAPVVLPVAVAVAVKAYDVVAGLAGPLPLDPPEV